MTNEETVEYVEKVMLPKLYVGEQGETVTNPESGQSCFLVPEAVALYEWVRGADTGFRMGLFTAAQEIEQTRKYHIIRDYFRLKWPKEYSILID